MKQEPVHQTKIKIVAIGGGVSAVVSEISSKMEKAKFVLADTRPFKDDSSNLKKVYFGEKTTRGFGTGMAPGLGELSAVSDKEKIKNIFKDQDICIIISCLGGGTGSGAMPVFAKMAKSMNTIVYGIFTLPFNFEGEKKMEYALSSIEKAKPYMNAYSVIPNEKIFEIVNKKTPIKEALSGINKMLTENLQGFIEMIYSPGLINIDFADVKTVFSGKGKVAFLNTVNFERANLNEGLRKIVSTPFFAYDIKGAKGVLYNIVGGKNLRLSEVSKISNAISSLAGRKAKIIFGINQSKKEEDKIKVAVLAIRDEEKKDPPKRKPKKKPPVEKRKNGMDIKKEEKSFLEEEDPFETPAILRKHE